MSTSKVPNYLFYSLIFSLFIGIGFFRDYFFNQYNTYLYQIYYKDMQYVVSEKFDFLKHFTYLQLYYAKFFLVGLFCIFYISLTLLTLKYAFSSKRYLILSLYFYAAIFATATIFYFYGMVTHHGEKYYELARTFLSLTQSPMILMILFPAFKIDSKQKSKPQENK